MGKKKETSNNAWEINMNKPIIIPKNGWGIFKESLSAETSTDLTVSTLTANKNYSDVTLQQQSVAANMTTKRNQNKNSPWSSLSKQCSLNPNNGNSCLTSQNLNKTNYNKLNNKAVVIENTFLTINSEKPLNGEDINTKDAGNTTTNGNQTRNSLLTSQNDKRLVTNNQNNGNSPLISQNLNNENNNELNNKAIVNENISLAIISENY